MKRLFAVLCFLIAVLVGCQSQNKSVNAADHGILPSNSGGENSRNLQKLIDELSLSGGTIYVPAGEYLFAENGSQTIGSHCIKMRTNVSIIGDGDTTVLKPVGDSQFGLDMFYFNDYLDTGTAVYLENCRFADFVIDASGTSCRTYTSAGKGFMFNLFRNCHWDGVTVKFTDATGFGVDCPFDSSMTNCTAIGCGKAATDVSSGASGFGIGYGYAAGENMQIQDCVSRDNKKFGFFFEHQGRFDTGRYNLNNQGQFTVIGCVAEGNLYNFGGICAENVIYQQCISRNARSEAVCFDACRNCVYNGEAMHGR